MNKIIKPILQYFPNFKGKLRLAKILYRQEIQTKNEVNFLLKKTNLKITVPNLIENVSFELFVKGEYEQETVDFFIDTIPQNGVFFDIGANIGAISFTLAKLRPDITIYAFEAAPFVFNYLKTNIEQNNLTNVICINKAIHIDDSITLPFYSSKEKNGKGSFSNIFTDDAVNVFTLNLDKFIVENNVKPNGIKVDVEGYEKLIFESMKNFLAVSNDTQILFEFVDWAEELSKIFKPGDAQKYVQHLGYNLFEITSKSMTPFDKVKVKGTCNVLAKK